MEIQKVHCMVKVREDESHDEFKLQIYKCGPDALPVTEIPLLIAMNGDGSVTLIEPVSVYEISKKDEYDRLKAKYKPEVMAMVYPSSAIPMPKTVEDLDLEAGEILSLLLPEAPAAAGGKKAA